MDRPRPSLTPPTFFAQLWPPCPDWFVPTGHQRFVLQCVVAISAAFCHHRSHSLLAKLILNQWWRGNKLKLFPLRRSNTDWGRSWRGGGAGGGGDGWKGYSFSAEVACLPTRMHLEFLVSATVNKKTNKVVHALEIFRRNPQKMIANVCYASLSAMWCGGKTHTKKYKQIEVNQQQQWKCQPADSKVLYEVTKAKSFALKWRKKKAIGCLFLIFFFSSKPSKTFFFSFG